MRLTNEEKRLILHQVTPKAVLKPLTDQAREAVPSYQLVGNFVCLFWFPFRVGRESRVRLVDGRLERIERTKQSDTELNNDLYLVDRGALLNISREHFLIEQRGADYRILDRGSACGTWVGGEPIGGKDIGGQHVLHDGEVIGVGTKDTPFLFQFISLAELFEGSQA